ncbi:zinc-finger-containing protein [Orrella sp. JC864]|uniref:zinc-finger-containing protein n=1 Tax=Orrella sp. JC864 TaxID=3120298 RepID=UPI00300A6917
MIEILGIDPRASSTQKLTAPAPLPYVSRRALGRVRDRVAPPSACDCCGGAVRLASNAEIYRGRKFGDWPYVYLCDACGAYIGLHPDTDLPLGTMANADLRALRKSTKRLFFDVAEHFFHGQRDRTYAWLAQVMGIDARRCHFGLFDIDACRAAEQACMTKLADSDTGEKRR